MEFDRKKLQVWLDLALETNTQYHLNRKNLLDGLLRCKGHGVAVRAREYFILKQYLSMRSEKLQKEDDAQLAFQEQIGRLLDACHEGDAESGSVSEAEEHKNDNAPKPEKEKKPKGTLAEV